VFDPADCGDSMRLEIQQGKLGPSDGVIHFAVPALEETETLFAEVGLTGPFWNLLTA
jgi:hypothetical protein